MYPTRAPVKNVLLRLSCIMLVAAALLPLTCLIAPIDLTGPLALAAYWIAVSGGTTGIPLIAIVMTALVVSRAGLSWKERAAEALVISIALMALLGVGAYLNEHFVKPVFAIHRPNIIELSEKPKGSPALQMSAKDFYGTMPTKTERSDYLKRVLTPESEPKMDEHVRGHWISESGYSFPSGHCYSAMLFSTAFLAFGLSYFSRVRLWGFYFLVVWAVAVCYSRPLLRVHSPTDVCVGGYEGILVGVVCFLLVRGVLEFFSPGRPGRVLAANTSSESLQPTK